MRLEPAPPTKAELDAVEAITNHLKGNLEPDLQYFLGGSTRFGWSLANQRDLDIFLYLPNSSVRETKALLESYYGTHQPIDDEAYPFGQNARVYQGNYYSPDGNNVWEVDFVCFFDNEFAWRSLKDEHQMVEEYLTAHPDVLLTLRQLRVHYVLLGKYIYRAAQALVWNEKYPEKERTPSLLRTETANIRFDRRRRAPTPPTIRINANQRIDVDTTVGFFGLWQTEVNANNTVVEQHQAEGVEDFYYQEIEADTRNDLADQEDNPIR